MNDQPFWQDYRMLTLALTSLAGLSSGFFAYGYVRARQKIRKARTREETDLLEWLSDRAHPDLIRLLGGTRGLRLSGSTESSFRAAIKRMVSSPHPVPLAWEGTIELSRGLTLPKDIKLVGHSPDITHLVCAQDEPLTIGPVTHDCAVLCNMAIEGNIVCWRSKLVLWDLELSPREGSAAVVATNDSVVTVGGHITGRPVDAPLFELGDTSTLRICRNSLDDRARYLIRKGPHAKVEYYRG